jgi:hypothetical protein
MKSRTTRTGHWFVMPTAQEFVVSNEYHLWVPEILSPYATCAYSWIRPPSLWGSEMRFEAPCGQLGSHVVLVGESAEDLFPVDPVLEVDGLGWAGFCLSRGELAEGAMRPGPCCRASGTRSAPGADAARR